MALISSGTAKEAICSIYSRFTASTTARVIQPPSSAKALTPREGVGLPCKQNMNVVDAGGPRLGLFASSCDFAVKHQGWMIGLSFSLANSSTVYLSFPGTAYTRCYITPDTRGASPRRADACRCSAYARKCSKYTKCTYCYYIGRRSTHKCDNYNSAGKGCTRGNYLLI